MDHVPSKNHEWTVGRRNHDNWDRKWDLLSVYFARKEGDRRVERATWNPELIIGEKRDWLQRHRRKSKRRLAAREKTGGGPFKTECADRSTRMNLGPIPASRVFFPPLSHASIG